MKYSRRRPSQAAILKREMDLHHRPLGYGPSELLLLYPALVKETTLSSLDEPNSKLSMVLYYP